MKSTNVSQILKENSKFKIDFKNKTDGLFLLRDINNNSISAAFFDPQYRGVLDKLQYGNEGKGRGKARSNLQQMSEDTIVQFIKEINRVLRPSGHLFLWVDKFHLCQGTQCWFEDTQLKIVDMITWDKAKFGMGYRSRRQSEYLLVLQKQPIKAKGCWVLHNIPDVWKESVVKNHPHSKPISLQQQLILATTKENDCILDPASGGYSVFSCCVATNRHFIGGDIEYGEN